MLPEYKNDAPLYSEPDEPPFESNWFTAMFFGYPLAFAVGIAIVLLALFN
jgi:hypothetical protein